MKTPSSEPSSHFAPAAQKTQLLLLVQDIHRLHLRAQKGQPVSVPRPWKIKTQHENQIQTVYSSLPSREQGRLTSQPTSAIRAVSEQTLGDKQGIPKCSKQSGIKTEIEGCKIRVDETWVGRIENSTVKLRCAYRGHGENAS